MPTVKQVSTEISHTTGKPEKSLGVVGRNISIYFRTWALEQRPEVISAARFVLTEEGGHKMIVVDYPEEFRLSMEVFIKFDLDRREQIAIKNELNLAERQRKQAEKEQTAAELAANPPKVRRRIPAGRVPVYSSKK